MRALILNTYAGGGAGLAMRRLQQNLQAQGMETVLAVLDGRSAGAWAHAIPPDGRMDRWRTTARRAWLKMTADPAYYFQDQSTVPVADPGIDIGRIPFAPDVIIAGWVSHFISADGLLRLSRRFQAPVLWYLLDMAPLTGGCHYAWDCPGYERRCGKCPALRLRHPHDASARAWERKRAAIEPMDLTVVAGTSLLSRQCREAGLMAGKPVETVLLAVDPDVFHPREKAEARAALGLPNDRRILLVGAQSLKVRRKGMRQLAEALRLLSSAVNALTERIALAIIGPGDELQAAIPPSFECFALGFIRDDRTLAAAYQAADTFVCPSMEDSGPMMINESLMCGTPVVSFDMGVAGDLVHTGTTGYRARLGDCRDLARGIGAILALSPDQRDAVARECRQLALRLCHPGVQARAVAAISETAIQHHAEQ